MDELPPQAQDDGARDDGPFDRGLLEAVRRMTPWERIRHNDRMIRTVRLLRGDAGTAKEPERGRG